MNRTAPTTIGKNPLVVVRRAAQIAAEDFWGVALTFAFLTIPPIWAGTYLPEDDALRFSAFLGAAALVPQILLTERALARHHMIEDVKPERPRYIFRAFGLSLLTTTAIILGLIALVIPGLFLLTRWSLSLPAMIARNQGIVGSLDVSWALTGERFWLCFLTIVIAWLPALIGILALILGEAWFSTFFSDVLAESLLSVSMLLSWFVAVTLYIEISFPKKSA